MDETERHWYAVLMAHPWSRPRPGRDEIDLASPPSLGPKKRYWPAYVASLVRLVEISSRRGAPVRLEEGRFLVLARRGAGGTAAPGMREGG